MPIEAQESECGWFYHPPTKKSDQSTDPVVAPCVSQVPGLGNMNDDRNYQDFTHKLYIKDTDTKYVQLAKQGGRHDLLRYKEFQPKSKEPVPYPRVNWFYLEDNAQEDAKPKVKAEKYEFRVPEYMAHGMPDGDEIDKEVLIEESTSEKLHLKPPFTFDEQTTRVTDGHPTSKSVRLPDIKKSGDYGGRAKNTKQCKVVTRPLIRPKYARHKADWHGTTNNKLIPPEDTSKLSMQKLLSFSYAKEWHDRVDTWYQKKTKEDGFNGFTGEQVGVTGNNNLSSWKDKDVRSGSGRARESARTKNQTEPKEPFKMSKFKNVPARVYSQHKQKDEAPDQHNSYADAENTTNSTDEELPPPVEQ